MRAGTAIVVWFMFGIVVLGADSPARSTQKPYDFNGPFVKAGVVPVIKLGRDSARSPAEAEEIKRDIKNLVRIESPDFGLSSTMSASAFAPIAGSESHRGGFLLTNHRVNTTEAVHKLVEFGPKALPYLLASLDYKTPTKLVIDQANSIFTVMYFSNEMPGNPTNTLEQTAIASLPNRDWKGETMTHYTVKVGDVCFAIIGQIVGRTYLAVRYQPTAIVIINSTASDTLLTKEVRSVWSSTNATQRLLDSLLFDYSTEGVFNGHSLDGWSIASDFQSQAAMRLLYYFPEETAHLIAERLSSFDVLKPTGGITNYIQREVANHVRTEDFLKAVSWSAAPAVRREVLRIFKETDDPELLLAALPGIDPKESDLISRRLSNFIAALPADEPGPYGGGYNLLTALGDKLGKLAKPTFIEYLKEPSLQRWRTMSHVLRKTRSEWAAELLFPALTDKRQFGWTYAVVRDQNEPRLPIRVCDEAAETISHSRPVLKFRMEGQHEELDRQIDIMRRLLSKEKQ